MQSLSLLARLMMYDEHVLSRRFLGYGAVLLFMAFAGRQ